ncbi:ERF family protein [Campylobacter sp. RM9344]|uniref:ERF family protein n=1 Tax=Campylobacter californiensis TaxID=1032243 RepID=A0AAW3ZZ81_9BACT|nr:MULTISPECIES: ERF family protein [unclassified Campylobacter]MBE2985329.1 ERF family protein [Campylobacter sp. RM6883]MBE2995862.1 ERF family protein [Campylobacter sp. RM6913]MBE3030295.1 ERF family protein [Campylobacter sp. RM9344]MBE3608745.1 ERF family protein [Campylobacter sp. RM9337]MBE3610517.1 ERF family protein [Campylobacter sp. RM12916]
MITILSKIQTELKAPKGQFNKFGGYSYRSCEDITEAVKPLLEKYEAALTISDEIVQTANRIYVKATATLRTKSGEISATAYAREAETKKGMDEAQITGSASSYARKYALNGLFAIDDEKDADATNTHEKEPQGQNASKQTQSAPREPLSLEQINDLSHLIEITNTDTRQFLAAFKTSDIKNVPFDKAKALLMKKLDKMNGVQNAS